MPLLDMLRARAPPGAGAPVTARTQYELKDFVGDQQGVDDMTTSTLTMLHNADTVTLINPFPETVAHFTIKTVETKKERLLWGNVKVSTSTKSEDVDLEPGQTKTVRLDEGEATILGTGVTLDRDIYVTLVSVDTPQGAQFTQAGQPIFGPGGYWSPQNVIKRVRSRRMIVGESGRGVFLTPAERTEITDLTKEGEIYSPRQLAMVRTAYLFDDVRRRIAEAGFPRRPESFEGASERPAVGVFGRFRSY